MPLLGILLAVTLSLRDHPDSTVCDGEFPVTAVLECTRCSDSYLRAVFYSSGTNYFGLTQNNAGEWISASSDKKLYYLVSESDIGSGTWSGQLRVRPDPGHKYYQGPGDYSFKLIRYTPSGSKSAESDPVVINITGPTVVPTSPPTPAREPTPGPSATHIPVVPTASLTPVSPTLSTTTTAVLASADFTEDASPGSGKAFYSLPQNDHSNTPAKNFPWLAAGLVILGTIGLASGTFYLIYTILKSSRDIS